MHGGLGGLSPEECLERWPETPRLLEALAQTGEVSVTGFWRAGPQPRSARPGRGRDQQESSLRRGEVTYRFVADHPRVAPRVAASVARLSPDVVHVNGMLFALPTLALRLRCPRHTALVVQHHGGQPGGRRQRAAGRLAFASSDGMLFTGGAAQAQAWREAGVIGRRAPIAGVLESSTDLVPLPQTAARRRTGVRGEPAVLWVGRLVTGKDPLVALQGFAAFAAAAMDSARPGAEESGPQLWMVCTDRDLEGQVRAWLAGRPDVAPRCHLVGPVAPAEMAEWYSSADLYLSTSRHEGSGYALIEAIACGCTPVVSDIPPHRAIAAGLGHYAPLGDAAAVAQQLRRATSALNGAHREAARAHFDRALSWDAAAGELIDAYRRAVAHRRAAVRGARS